MNTIYQLTIEYQNLLALAEDPDTDFQTLSDTIEALNGEIEAEAENYIIVMRELEAEAKKFESEIERLSKYRNSLLRNANKIKEALLASMQATNHDKIKTEHFKLSIAKNGGLRPLKLGDFDKIPDEYMKLEPIPDTKKIRETLESGKKLTFAELLPRGTHLNIR